MRIIREFRQVLLVSVFSLLATSVCFAEENSAQISTEASPFPETPHETIELVTTELLSDLQALLDVYDESAEKFYTGIDEIVSPWIDFDSFYKGVMGRKYYTEATQEQRDRFKEVFHKSLIETYGKGLLGVEETRFEIEPAKLSKKPGGSAQVKQTLFSGSGRVVVFYTMGQAEDGRWRLKNVVLEGINLGKTFRNQFARSARENAEDLDLVINSWSSQS